MPSQSGILHHARILRSSVSEGRHHRISPRRGTIVVLCVVLAVLVLSTFAPVMDGGFITMDDEDIVTKNGHIQSGFTPKGVRWAFSTLYWGNYMPLTWLSHMLDIEIWNLDPQGHHLSNLIFHLVNVILLFLVLYNLTGALKPSFIATALFALHPLRVEPVAWISARRDLLSTFFLILAIGAYRRYCSLPSLRRYTLVLVAFLLGLMSKPMIVTLPLCLLLLDYWPLQRLGCLRPNIISPASSKATDLLKIVVLEKLPFFFVSAAWVAVTYLAQERVGALKSFQDYPVGVRISNAVCSYVGYLSKTLWPANLAIFYPHPMAFPPLWKPLSAAILLGGMSYLTLLYRRKHPYLIFGWVWYVLTLTPVIGFVQIGGHSMADRFTYVPHIGLFITAAWAIHEVYSKRRFSKPALVMFVGTLIVAYSIIGRAQTLYWHDDKTAYLHAQQVTDNNWLALNNLGAAYKGLGQHQQAIAHYQAALRIKPSLAEAWCNLGFNYNALGQYQQAIGNFAEALRLKPNFAEAHYGLAESYNQLGQYQQAIGNYREALRIKPDYVEALCDLGNLNNKIGQYRQAIDYFVEALRYNPGLAEAYNNLGVSYHELGQYQQAIEYYREALRIKPEFNQAWNNLGLSYEELGQHQQAVDCYDNANKPRP